MRRVLLLLLAATYLSYGVSAQTTLSMKEDAVNQNLTMSSVDSTKEKVEIAAGSTLPSHFVLYPDGKIELTNAAGADYENPKLRNFTFKVSVKNIGTGAGMLADSAMSHVV